MTKHTPGPWTQTGQDIVSETLRETLRSGREVRLRIANAKDAGGRLDLETVKANARLIAAAPELLAALTDLVGFTVNIMEDGTREPECVKRALSAIARAEGEDR